MFCILSHFKSKRTAIILFINKLHFGCCCAYVKFPLCSYRLDEELCIGVHTAQNVVHAKVCHQYAKERQEHEKVVFVWLSELWQTVRM